MIRFFLMPLVLMMFFALPAQASQMGIAVVVNDDVVTMKDLNDRIHMSIVTAGMPNTSEVRAGLKPQALGALITEQLQLQEAAQEEIEVPQEMIDAEFTALAQRNNLAADDFRAALTQRGVALSTLERQLKAGIAWRILADRVLRPKVKVTEVDITAQIDRVTASIGTKEYLVSEIVLPVERPVDEVKTRELAGRVVHDIRGGKAAFGAVAQQLSKAPGAQQGGSIGWVQLDQLEKILAVTLQNMQPGQIADPVRSISGYHILGLQQVREVTEDQIPARDAVRESLYVKQLNRLGQRYIQDLRSDAFIDERV